MISKKKEVKRSVLLLGKGLELADNLFTLRGLNAILSLGVYLSDNGKETMARFTI